MRRLRSLRSARSLRSGRGERSWRSPLSSRGSTRSDPARRSTRSARPCRWPRSVRSAPSPRSAPLEERSPRSLRSPRSARGPRSRRSRPRRSRPSGAALLPPAAGCNASADGLALSARTAWVVDVACSARASLAGFRRNQPRTFPRNPSPEASGLTRLARSAAVSAGPGLFAASIRPLACEVASCAAPAAAV